MAWFRRGKARDPLGGVKASPVGPTIVPDPSAMFPTLGEPWAWNGRVIVPDPGIPLLEYAADPYELWRSQPSIRKVCDYIARNVSSIPIHLYRRVSDTDRERVTSGPVAELLRRPGRTMTAYRLWHALIVDWLLYDRWCAQVVPSADTASGWELLRIPAPRMRLLGDGWGRVDAVLVQGPDGQRMRGTPQGFVFDHGYASYGQVNGTSAPLETLARLLAESDAAIEYRRQIWRNGARVPTVIERPAEAGKWSTEAKSRFREMWRRFISGGGQEGGTPILEDGMKLSKVDAFSPRDLADLEGRRLTDIEVANAYHIPPELVGAREGTYSNIDAYRQMLYRDALGPLIVAIEQALNTMLLPVLAPGAEGDDLYIELNVDAKLRGSFEEQSRVLQSSVGAPWLTRNEARARTNLPAVEGGDELVTPLNVVTGGIASPRDTAPAPDERDDDAKTARLVPSPKARGRVKAARPEDLATFDREAQAFADSLTAWTTAQGDRLLAAMDAKADGPGDLYALWGETADARRKQLAALIRRHTYRLALVGAWDVLEQWNPDADGWSTDVMLPWLAVGAESRARQHDQAGYDAAAEAIAAGGDWRANLRHAAEVWVSAAGAHAATAATESRAFGGHDAAEASGLTRKTWITGPDPRPAHAAMDGETVDTTARFSNGLRWPGDHIGPAADTVNCNCRLRYARGE